MNGKIKLVLGCVVVLGGLGLLWAWGAARSSAKITFEAAQLGTNSTLMINYYYTTPPKTHLRQVLFRNGKVILDSDRNLFGTSLPSRPFSVFEIFSLFGSRRSTSNLRVSVPDIASAPPASLVATGRIYSLKLQERLTIYNVTNNSGATYRGELSLEKQK